MEVPGPLQAVPEAPEAVKPALTPRRRREVVENPEFAAFAARILRAAARRVAGAATAFEAGGSRVERPGHCSPPIRLQGRVRQVDKAWGEIRQVYSTEHEPDQTLLVACGNRRACVCPSCSALYKGDARHL